MCLWGFFQNYFRDCLFDLCELDGAKPILCEAIEAYVNECQDRGVDIGPWRNETFCRECWVNKRMENDRRLEECREGNMEATRELLHKSQLSIISE